MTAYELHTRLAENRAQITSRPDGTYEVRWLDDVGRVRVRLVEPTLERAIALAAPEPCV